MKYVLYHQAAAWDAHLLADLLLRASVVCEELSATCDDSHKV